jgi:hypothetical protein
VDGVCELSADVPSTGAATLAGSPGLIWRRSIRRNASKLPLLTYAVPDLDL